MSEFYDPWAFEENDTAVELGVAQPLDSSDLLVGLNDEQARAVVTTDGPVLILAGAGSGKTKTLTHRIAHLLQSNLATPYNILAVTFTNKAAKEMRERVALLTGNDATARSFMPFMGTFHSICVRILRQDGEHVGVDPRFVIFDESDRLSLVRQQLVKHSIGEKQFSPKAILGHIGSAKNEMVDPVEYKHVAEGPLQTIVAKVYPGYEADLRKANGLDFDDLIGMVVKLLIGNEKIRTKWQDQFRYVMIDEYQDTNAAQYKLVKLLTNKNNNICVVGDDWQCLLPDTLVDSTDGLKMIKDIESGEKIITASGYGRTISLSVERKKRFEYNGNVIKVKTASGKSITCTPNHLLFARFDSTEKYFVYLMYAKNKGYRIGLAKGTRFDGKKDDIGLRVRANLERADKMWILKICDTKTDASHQEAFYSYKYGIPMMVFYAMKNRKMNITQDQIDHIFSSIDTRARAAELMGDEGILVDHPHFVPQATTRGNTSRTQINVVLFGDSRVTNTSQWSASRISANTTNIENLRVFEQLGYSVRKGRAGTYRSEIRNLDYGVIEKKLNEILSSMEPGTDITVDKYAFISGAKFRFIPAGQLHPDMVVPILKDGVIVPDRVISVEKSNYDGLVYDLDIEKVHNYVAGGIVVHNSVYSWRGADFRNILNFERDYPDAAIVKLEQNYRSTKAILDAAHTVISKNTERSEKKLWTALGDGRAVKVMQVPSDRAEGEMIARAVQISTDMRARNYNEYAVLYRTNAQSRSLEDQFMRMGIPYRIYGGLKFYDRKEVKDIIAYLRLIYQPEDTASFERIANTPTRSLGDTSLLKFRQWRESNSLGLLDALKKVDDCTLVTPKARTALKDIYDIVDKFGEFSASMNVADLLDKLIKRIDYFKYLDDGTTQGETRAENVRELMSVAKSYAETGMSSFLEEVALVSDNGDESKGDNCVTFMTMHSAKGLEFPVVYIVGMEEGVFPMARAAYDPKELEEERRLAYVGMTRAKEELTLIYASSRLLYGQLQYNPPSQFLRDIDTGSRSQPMSSKRLDDNSPDISFEKSSVPEEPRYVPELEVGDGVRHSVFGMGSVVNIVGDNADILFKTKGLKKLNIAFAPLEKL
jgi:DNA helicase II / ATP-dependent DNA helicase PcrA